MERTATLVCASLLLVLPFNRSANAQAPAAEGQHRTERRTNGPTGFEENKGQVLRTDGQPAPFVKYRLAQGNALVFLLENGIAYQFNKSLQDPDFARLMGKLDLTPAERTRFEEMMAERRSETYRMDMVLEGARPDPRITTTGRSTDHTNYYNHPSGPEYASLDVHCYQQVVYHDVYPGIDWSLSLNGDGIEQDFIVAPGADPSAIKLRFKDHEELLVDDNGRLIHGNRLGRFTEEKPVSWQGTAQVPTEFSLDGDVLTFSLGEYDPSRTLRIDPPRVWATYYGGTLQEFTQGVAVDNAGSVYIAGWTSSSNASNVIAENGYDLSLSGPPDAYLAKFEQGGQRIWGTYYGGTGEDRFGYCAVSGTSVYASGLSASPGLATVHQTTLGGGIWDALLAKFTADGTFVWSTYYGGDQEDKARHCATDPSGNVYMAGHTFSDHPPNQGVISSGGSVHQATYGGFTDGDMYYTGDGFLVKFNSTGTRQWGTYYGGSNDDEAYGCATDVDGNVYISGATQPLSGPAIAPPGGHQTVFGLGAGGALDGYLAKFNTDGERQWGTYYGGNGSELGYDCCVDNAGNVYLAGVTQSTSPFEAIGYGNGHQLAIGDVSGDAFLVKFTTGGQRVWGTYHGGNGYESALGCATDNADNVYLTGGTASTNAAAFALHAFQPTFQGGDEDAFLAGFDANGNWIWGTYYGGTGAEGGCTVSALTDQFVYMVGQTQSNSPPNGAISQDPGWQTTYGGSQDGFLVRFDYRIDCNGEPGGDLQVGSPCDDGDNYTVGDALNEECLCGGTMSCALPIPVTLGQSDTEDLSGSITVTQSNRWYRLDISACVDLTLHLCPGSNITGLVLGYLYDACPQDGFDFFETTTANGCGGNDMTWEDVPAGTYYYEMTVTGTYFGQFITTPCSEVVDCLGVTGGSALPGTACNDNNACTINDVYTGTAPSCGCVGTPVTVSAGISVAETSGVANDGITCSGATVTLTASGGTSYSWSPGGSTANPLVVSPTATTTYTLTATTNAGCTGTAPETITVNAPPTTATTGGAQTVCVNGTTASLGGNTATSGTGAWSVVSGGTGTFSNAASPASTFTHTGGTGPVVVRWTISNAPCTASTANVTITISPDTDGDGVCDLNDNCPNVAGQQGSACNDDNACTDNDALNVNCVCTGTLNTTDSDSDGVPNCSDNCPNVTGQQGSTCSDGNACTVNDVLNASCQCMGTTGPDSDGDGILNCNDNCPNLSGEQGDSCDDLDSDTSGDVITLNCVCAGVLINDCEGVPGGPAQPGTSCDDDDVCTTTDVYSTGCVCAGTYQDTDGDGTCDANDPCNNNTDGDTCDDGDACTVNDVLTNCSCAGTTDNSDTDGDDVPDCSDNCPNVDGQQGSTCDDGNGCTDNDVLSLTCICAGTLNTTDSDGDGVPNCTDNCPNVAGQQGSPCDDEDTCTDNDMLNANCDCTGTLNTTDSDGDAIPDCSDDCPDVAGEVGSPCDDGNAETLNDQLDTQCECHGQECSPGNSCSDDDDCTINDTWDSGCVCTGVGLVLGPIQGNTLLADGLDYTFTTTVFTNDGNMTPVPDDQFLWQWTGPDNDWFSADWTSPVLQVHADSSHGPVQLCVAVTIGNCPAFEACMTVQVIDVGISEHISADPFSVRPNPSTGRFEIVGDRRVGLQRLTVEDATGRAIPMVTENSGANRIVDLGDAVPGIYLLRLWHDHGAQVLRLVVRR